MAKKTAVVDIKLTGKQSLQELERELERVNEQISRFKEGEGGFDMWSKKAEELKAEIANVNAELANTGGGDVTAKVEKTGEAMADAFKEGGDAVNEFAEEGVDAMTDVVDETGSLGDAIQVVSKIGQTFATGMGGNLKGVSKGFAVMGQSAKVAGASIKATMAATGIGALLIVLQVLIMNWDKLSAAIKKTRREKELLEKQDLLKKEVEYIQAMTAEYEKQTDAQKKINESQGNAEANVEVDYQLAKRKTEELSKQNELLLNQTQLAEIQAKKDSDRFEKAMKNSNGFFNNLGRILLYGEKAGVMEIQKLGTLAQQATESERQANILNEQITTNQKLLELYTEQNRLSQVKADKKKTLDDLDAEISRLENANLLLEAEGERTKDIYANNQKINSLKKERLGVEILIKGNAEAQDKIALKTLDAERAAAKIANDRRVAELILQTNTIANEIEYNKLIRGINNGMALQFKYADGTLKKLEELTEEERKFYDVMLTGLNRQQNTTEESLKASDKRLELLYQEVEATQRLADYDDYRTQAQIKAFPFDKKGLEILQETLGLRSDEIKILAEFEGINVNVAQLSQRIKLEYLQRIDAMNAMHIKQLDILATQKETNDEAKKSLENEIIIANEGIKYANIMATGAENGKDMYQQILNAEMAVDDSQKNWEKIVNAQENILRLDNEIAKYNADAAGYANEIYQAQQGINALDLENLQIKGEITAENETYANSQAQITYELETQLRLYARMQEFLGKYAEEIQATQELISQSLEFVAVMYDRQADEAAAKMKKLNDELKKLEKREENINELKEELKDADGERYDNLLALIAQEEEAELNKNMSIEEQRKAIEAEIAAQEAKKMEAEYQAAKWRKAQAIIDAVIAGALATIKALPNVVLAALTAALSAVNVGIIASQKLPEKPPKQALGGYIDGKSHAQGGEIVEIEGGEYIINKKSTSQYLPLLEAINNAGIKKYAEGGTTAPVMTNNTDDFFDYDRMAEAVLKGIQPTVSVVEINRMQRRVRVLESKARI